MHCMILSSVNLLAKKDWSLPILAIQYSKMYAIIMSKKLNENISTAQSTITDSNTVVHIFI